jgi:hypothetical protein
MNTKSKTYGAATAIHADTHDQVLSLCDSCNIEDVLALTTTKQPGFSVAFTKYMSNRLKKIDFKQKQLLFRERGLKNGQYRYDFFAHNGVGIQFSFGNRQVVARQLFMPTIANASQVYKPISTVGVILITFSENVKSHCHVDSSIGTFDEYCMMADLGQSLFHCPVTIIGVGL